MVQGEQVGEANETAAGKQEGNSYCHSSRPIENRRLNTGKSLPTRDGQKGNGNAEGSTKKKKVLGRFKSGHKKR